MSFNFTYDEYLSLREIREFYLNGGTLEQFFDSHPNITDRDYIEFIWSLFTSKWNSAEAISKAMGYKIKDLIKEIFRYVGGLQEAGYTISEIEKATGIQIKRDHICIFDISE